MPSSPSPFLEPDNPSLAAMIGDAAVHLLVDRGLVDLSSRAIAGYLRVTPPALTQQANRAEQLRLLVVAIGQRWISWSCSGGGGTGLPARLPGTDDELHGVRVWAAVAELARGESARGNPVPSNLLDTFRNEERDLVAWNLDRILDRPPRPDEVVLTVALVAGLREELIAPRTRLPFDQACALLERHVDRLRSSGLP
jgi:hypothetical protein